MTPPYGRLLEVLLQKYHCLSVAVQSLAHDGFDAGFTCVAYLPEILPLADIGDMDFHSGDPHGL